MLIRKEKRERGRAGELLFALLYMILIGSVLVAGGMWGRGWGCLCFPLWRNSILISTPSVFVLHSVWMSAITEGGQRRWVVYQPRLSGASVAKPHWFDFGLGQCNGNDVGSSHQNSRRECSWCR